MSTLPPDGAAVNGQFPRILARINTNVRRPIQPTTLPDPAAHREQLRQQVEAELQALVESVPSSCLSPDSDPAEMAVLVTGIREAVGRFLAFWLVLDGFFVEYPVFAALIGLRDAERVQREAGILKDAVEDSLTALLKLFARDSEATRESRIA
jgi:hypothetical protein